MAANRQVYAPDGRAWIVTRRPRGDALVTRLLRSEGWVVEASTAGPPAERRLWHADGGPEAGRLVDAVALALRTGAEGPPENAHRPPAER